ncbi:hypothetical protein F4776DRAFT_662404 [Hypoxylon sp. NC0597]|nr:hypothetical protein F4776DRAFT_662404 [Hypoxylon sp. NC0597]
MLSKCRRGSVVETVVERVSPRKYRRGAVVEKQSSGKGRRESVVEGVVGEGSSGSTIIKEPSSNGLLYDEYRSEITPSQLDDSLEFHMKHMLNMLKEEVLKEEVLKEEVLKEGVLKG